MELDSKLSNSFSKDVTEREIGTHKSTNLESLIKLERRLFIIAPLALENVVKLVEIKNLESAAAAIIDKSGKELDYLGTKSLVTYVSHDPEVSPEMIEEHSLGDNKRGLYGGVVKGLHRMKVDRSRNGIETENRLRIALSRNHDISSLPLRQEQVGFRSSIYSHSTLPPHLVQNAVLRTNTEFETQIKERHRDLDISRTGLLLIIHSGDAQRSMGVDKERLISGDVAMLTKASDGVSPNKFEYLS